MSPSMYESNTYRNCTGHPASICFGPSNSVVICCLRQHGAQKCTARQSYQAVSGALICRRRPAGPHCPLRSPRTVLFPASTRSLHHLPFHGRFTAAQVKAHMVELRQLLSSRDKGPYDLEKATAAACLLRCGRWPRCGAGCGSACVHLRNTACALCERGRVQKHGCASRWSGWTAGDV